MFFQALQNFLEELEELARKTVVMGVGLLLEMKDRPKEEWPWHILLYLHFLSMEAYLALTGGTHPEPTGI